MNEIKELFGGKAPADLTVVLIALIASTVAIADTNPASTSSTKTSTLYTLCDAQAFGDTGVCTDGSGGDEIVLDGSGLKSVTFYSNESTASSYTCNVMSSSVGFDAAPSGGFKVNQTALSAAQKIITLTGPFVKLWITCPTITDGAITVKAHGIKDI